MKLNLILIWILQIELSSASAAFEFLLDNRIPHNQFKRMQTKSTEKEKFHFHHKSKPVSPIRVDFALNNAVLERPIQKTKTAIPSTTFGNWKKRKYSNFQRKQHTNSNSTEMVQSCNGFDNILNDLGILGLVTGMWGAGLGISTFILSSWSILVSISSVVITGSGSAVIGFFDLLDAFTPFNIDFTGLLRPFILVGDALGIIDKLKNTYINIPFSYVTNLISGLGDVLSIVSLALGITALFPQELEDVINLIFTNDFVDNYGCNNPYKQIMNLQV